MDKHLFEVNNKDIITTFMGNIVVSLLVTFNMYLSTWWKIIASYTNYGVYFVREKAASYHCRLSLLLVTNNSDY